MIPGDHNNSRGPYTDNLRITKSLRDSVEDEAARRGITKRNVWRWALDAMLHNQLPLYLREKMTLDTPFTHGGMSMTWRGVVTETLLAVNRHDPSDSAWTRSLEIDPLAFRSWLDDFLTALTPAERLSFPQRSRRRVFKKAAGKKEAARSALEALYSSERPLASIKTITGMVNKWLADNNGDAVSEDTVSRVLKDFRVGKPKS